METFKTIAINMIVTFFEAGLAVWATTGFTTDKLALGAAIGAGASAAWNIVIKPLLKKIGWMK
jgi:hypothetical protein